MARAGFLWLMSAIVSSGVWAQAQPGQVWFELPDRPCLVSWPYMVDVHIYTGAEELNNTTFTVTFDPGVLGVAFSEAGQTNADLIPGASIVGAGLEADLLYHHDSETPGTIRVALLGSKSAKAALTGDIEILRIVFHPQAVQAGVQLSGAVQQLWNNENQTIGTPGVISVLFDIVEAQMPTGEYGGVAAVCLLAVLAAGYGLRRAHSK